MEILANYHPLIIHFPIVLFLLYILFEFISLFSTNKIVYNIANLILFLGVLAGIAAVLTGNQAAEVAMRSNIGNTKWLEELIDKHEQYATITVWYFAIILTVRYFLTIKKKFTLKLKITFVILAIVGSIFVFETGEHGGDLVYEHGVGTSLFQQSLQNSNSK